MAATTLMSFADFERLEQGADKIELLKGELIRVPPAQNAHIDVSEGLFKRLDAAVEDLRQAGHDLPVCKVHMERGYRFQTEPPSWLQPDVSVTHPGQPIDRYYVGAPLIAFEVVSPSDTAPELHAKVEDLLANGSAEVWLIYPDQRHAWVYESSGAAHREVGAIHSPLLPGIEISLNEIL